jgi:hypothetical protein
MTSEKLPTTGDPKDTGPYTLLCTAALLLLGLPLFLRGLGEWSLFPVLVGLLALVLRWRSGPVLVLLALFWLSLADRTGVSPAQLVRYLFYLLARFLSAASFRWPLRRDHAWMRLQDTNPLLDLTLAAAMVMYVAAHYRLMGLTHGLFPADPRLTKKRRKPPMRPAPLPPAPGARTHVPSLSRELAGLLVGMTASLVVAFLVWQIVLVRDPDLDLYELFQQGLYTSIPLNIWRIIVLVWILALVLFLAWGLLGLLRQHQMSPVEARMFLQDKAWRETRREQSRGQRWLTWATLRERRQEPGREEP